jgi:hypothetical protein
MTMEHIERSFAVSLHILHPSIAAETISSALQLAPSQIKRSGPPRKPPYDQAVWSYRFDCQKVRDLVPFLEETVLFLHAHRDFLRSVVDSDGSIELFCGIYMSTNWDELFPHSLSAKLADLRIDLRLDAYPEDAAKA